MVFEYQVSLLMGTALAVYLLIAVVKETFRAYGSWELKRFVKHSERASVSSEQEAAPVDNRGPNR